MKLNAVKVISSGIGLVAGFGTSTIVEHGIKHVIGDAKLNIFEKAGVVVATAAIGSAASSFVNKYVNDKIEELQKQILTASEQARLEENKEAKQSSEEYKDEDDDE